MTRKYNGLRLAGLALMLMVAGSAWAASQETVLYAFHGTDGSVPNSVIIGPDGVLYGTTTGGASIIARSAAGWFSS